MKKLFSILLSILLLFALAVPAMAATEPVITQQPQSPTYKEFAVATYSVTVKGQNLHCNWYMSYKGAEYNISDMSGGMQPWENYAGSGYGANVNTSGDTTTFTYYFEGIGKELDGCYIYAVIEDGHFDITSNKAYIHVTPYEAAPPTINVPASMEVYQGDVLDLYCSATSPDGSALSYLWYSCSYGKIENIIAVNRGTEDKDTLRVDTSHVGKQYYVCLVTTASGGSAYSSMIPVTVLEKTESGDPPEITTKTLPDAIVGQEYYVKLKCTDPDASFGISYNPGKANEFEKTGLNLTQHGEIEGTPTKAGTYGFLVCAAGENGEGYQVYTLKIKEAEATEPEQTEEPTESETNETTEATEEPTEALTEAVEPSEAPQATEETTGGDNDGNKINSSGGVWMLFVFLLILLMVLAVPAVVVIIIVMKKKSQNKE